VQLWEVPALIRPEYSRRLFCIWLVQEEIIKVWFHETDGSLDFFDVVVLNRFAVNEDFVRWKNL